MDEINCLKDKRGVSFVLRALAMIQVGGHRVAEVATIQAAKIAFAFDNLYFCIINKAAAFTVLNNPFPPAALYAASIEP